MDVRNQRIEKLGVLRVWSRFTLNRNKFEGPEKDHNDGRIELVRQVSSRTNSSSSNEHYTPSNEIAGWLTFFQSRRSKTWDQPILP
jgi:hypothetical protein